MTQAFVSEAELRAAAPELDLSRYTSQTISGMLTTATVLAENFLNYSLAFESKVEKARGLVDSNGDIFIFPKKRPIRSLESVVLSKGRFTSNITLSANGENFYDIVDDSKIIISSSQISLQSVSIIDWSALRFTTFFMNITYTAGYYPYDRPQDIVEAVLLYARDLFARSQNSSGASEISQGAVSIKYADTKGKSDFVKDAELILQGYQAVAGF